MEDRCVCCGEIIPEGQQVCRKCKGGSRMNKEGYRDPTPEQAMRGIRREEKIRALEERYRVHRGDKVIIYDKEEDKTRTPGKKRVHLKARKMKVIGVYTNFILLQDKFGIKESFRWQEFFEKLKRE